MNYKPYPHNRPGPRRPDNRKSEITPDVKLRPFNYAAMPVKSIKEINWNKIVAVAVPERESQKYIYLETEEGALILKGSEEVAIDNFINKLSLILCVPVP